MEPRLPRGVSKGKIVPKAEQAWATWEKLRQQPARLRRYAGSWIVIVGDRVFGRFKGDDPQYVAKLDAIRAKLTKKYSDQAESVLVYVEPRRFR